MAINIKSGRKTISIKDEDGSEIGSFSFYPEDADTSRRIVAFARKLEALDVPDDVDDFENGKYDAMMSEVCAGLDKALNTSSSESLFRVLSPLALVENEKGEKVPYLVAILPAITEEVNEAAKKIALAKMARIDKAVKNA